MGSEKKEFEAIQEYLSQNRVPVAGDGDPVVLRGIWAGKVEWRVKECECESEDQDREGAGLLGKCLAINGARTIWTCMENTRRLTVTTKITGA